MSGGLFKLFGAAVLCTLLGLVVKKGSSDTALVLKIIGGAILAAASVFMMTPVIEFAKEITEISSSAGLYEAIDVLLRVLGIALLTHICATVCRDAGEGSLAYYVELGGKVEMIICALPLFKKIIEVAIGLLEI